jgi:hypothetical protein
MTTWSGLAVVGVLGLLHGGCAGLFCVACDGYLGVEGQVYEWNSLPGGKSAVWIDDEIPADQDGLRPLDGCDVTVEPWSPKKRPKPETARVWTSRSKTDARGWFKVGGTAKPGWYDVTLTVRCGAVGAKEHVFRHDRFRHQALVILVPESVLSEGASMPHNKWMQELTKPAPVTRGRGLCS